MVAATIACFGSRPVAKAFGAGADFVMLGGMFAGCEECDGVFMDGQFKFYGMSSKLAVDKYNGGMKNYRASEGLVTTVAEKGPVEGVVQNVLGGLRSCCTYVGANSLKDLSKCTTFVRCNSIK